MLLVDIYSEGGARGGVGDDREEPEGARVHVGEEVRHNERRVVWIELGAVESAVVIVTHHWSVCAVVFGVALRRDARLIRSSDGLVGNRNLENL